MAVSQSQSCMTFTKWLPRHKMVGETKWLPPVYGGGGPSVSNVLPGNLGGGGWLFLPANHNRPCDFWGKWLLRLVGGSGTSGRSCRRGTCQSRPCSPWAVGVRAGQQLGGLGWLVPHASGPQSSPQTGGAEPTLWPGQHWGRPWPGRKPLVPMLGLCGTFVSWPEGCSRWGLPS